MLVSGDVRGVPAVIEMAKNAASIIRMNLFIAMSFTAVMLPMAFFNCVVPAVGAAVMASSSILVVMNSLRLALKERGTKVEGGGMVSAATKVMLPDTRVEIAAR